jgi:hypothetical protein
MTTTRPEHRHTTIARRISRWSAFAAVLLFATAALGLYGWPAWALVILAAVAAALWGGGGSL